MRCNLCGTKESSRPSYTERSYCAKHFREMIIRRVRKDIRIHQTLKTNTQYYITGDEPQKTFLKELLDEIFEKRLTLTDHKGVELSAELQETYASRLFEEFITGKKTKSILRPLRRVSYEDMHLLGYTCKKKTHTLLEKLKKQQESSYFAIIKSLEKK